MSAHAFAASYVEPLDSTAERYLVVNADDLGRSVGVNEGIFRAHERGIVTSASLMVRWPAAEHAAESIGAHPRLGVGLHVDLSEWSVRAGQWRCEYEVVPIDDAAAVAEEASRQLERFERLVGREPTHLDSHQHVHRHESVGGVLLNVARRLGVPLRDCTPGVRYRGDFYGQTSKGDPYSEGITVEALLELMEGLEPGVTEVACHPADGDPADQTYGRERAVELATLCDPRVRLAAVERGIELRSYDDVHSRLDLGSRAWERDLRERGIAALRAGDWRTACAWLARALAIDPESTSAWVWRSKAEQQGGDTAAALRSAERALALEPTWASVRLQFADALGDAGRAAEAGSILQELVQAHADDVQILRRVVRRLAQFHDGPRALQAADRLLELQPGDEEGRFTKASCLWRSGDRAAAAAALNGAEARKPASVRAAARLFLEVGEPLRAWAALRSLPEQQVTRPLLLASGHALRRAGAIAASQEAFERAVASAPNDADARHYRDVVAGEASVLRDGWTAPAIRRPRLYRRVRGRVLHVVGHSAPHTQVGYTVRTQYVTRAQREAGLDPHVVTRLGYPWDEGVADAADRDDIDGIVHHRLRPDAPIPVPLGDRLSETLSRAAALVRELRPSVLHAASDYRNALIAQALGRSFGIPVVYEVRGFWEETRLATQGPGAEERDSYRWHCERELACLRSADAVVTLAEVMKEELVRRGVDEASVTVVPNAVDVETFRPLERDDALAVELGFEPHDVVLGYVSSLSAYEGVGYLIEAVALLAAAGESVRCLVVGDGDERSVLERRADELEIPDRVVFTGRVPHADVLRHYSLIDVFVVPRTADRVSRLVTPLKPYEAMAAGRAVVVSGVPALREMVMEGITGLVFPPEDARGLAEVVKPLVRDREVRRTLGASARKWVCENRTWNSNGLLYRDLYCSLGAA